MDHAIANQALHLAMEWGEHWLMPTQKRLGALHPELSQRELDVYDKLARKVMREAQAVVAELAQEHGGDGNAVQQACPARVRLRVAWISEENLGRLVSQSMYYAWKDGGLR